MEARSLLLVEDDLQLAAMLRRVLEEEGYALTHAADGQRGLHLGLSRSFDVIVVDRGLPAVEGLQVLAHLRDAGVVTPALVLSARGTSRDRVQGLDAGAEDYLAKPFDLDELLARLRALLRRHQEGSGSLSLGRSRLHLATRVVVAEGRPDVALSEREAELLAVLARRPGQVFGRADLLARVFSDAGSPTVVDTYVHYCRRKLGRDVIRTVRGLGYRLGSA